MWTWYVFIKKFVFTHSPVAHKAMNVCVCLINIWQLQVVWSTGIFLSMWLIKSWAVTEDISHFKFVNTNNSHIWNNIIFKKKKIYYLLLYDFDTADDDDDEDEDEGKEWNLKHLSEKFYRPWKGISNTFKYIYVCGGMCEKFCRLLL